MQTPVKENVTSITNEAPPPVEGSPENLPAETGSSGLKGEIGAETIIPGQPQPKSSDDGNKGGASDPKNKTANIIDKSNEKIKTHKVSPQADSLTTIADKDEEEFIIGVETAHHEHK